MNISLRSLLIIFSICILLICEIQCAQRFKDDQMMKKHHSHLTSSNDVLTVHLIQHSHDDVGWLKTVDNYFYGGDTSTQWAGVQYTIDTVVSELASNQNYKFSIVEVAFLYRWWNQATQTQRDQMKKLVQNGQIQFINGGWCMSDQAAAYYQDVVDQMAIGHRWLKDTFGVTPTAAWHIDPFGHQASSASMFNRMGLQSFFFARIDYQDKQLRLNKKTMQMLWHPYQYNADKSNYIFTHVNYYHYSAPPGFNFDLKNQDQPIKDDVTLQDYNVDKRSQTLVNYFKSMALHYRSSNLMHTMGQDFTHANAHMWYKNTDKLIAYINSRPAFGVKLVYSTPGQYVQAVQKQANTYPTKTDDFFPYADCQHGYWTGYFTSRTGLKGFVRELGRWIQAMRKHISQLKITGASSVVTENAKKIQDAIWGLQMAQGILQHHDGVSGTSKQKVAYDYVDTGLRAINQAVKLYSQVKTEQINKEIGETISPNDVYFNVFWNETAKFTGLADKLNGGQTVLVNLYNPGSAGNYEIRFGVPQVNLKIVDSNNQAIKGDVICANSSSTQNCQLILNLQMAQSSNNYIKLSKVSNVADASAKYYDLTELKILDREITLTITSSASLKITRSNQQFDLTMNGNTQTFFVAYKYYQSYAGVGQTGGAYIFRPASDVSKIYSNVKKVWYVEGTQAVYIVMDGDFISTTMYFSKVPSYIEQYGVQIKTFVNSISLADKIGKQIVMNVKTQVANSKTFYTDSNGLQQQKRILNFRPTWNLTVHEAVAGNYYPINSHIRIEDKSKGKNVTLLTDRSVGGSVLNEGQFQILIHRRLTRDDYRGVGQHLDQLEYANGPGLTQFVRQYLVFGNKYRELQKAKDQKIMLTFAKTSSNTFSKSQIRAGPLKVDPIVKLYLRPFTDDSYLVRLHSMDMQKQTTVQIPDGWTLTELTLSGNQLWSDWTKKQYTWKEEAMETSTIDVQANTFTDLQDIAESGLNFLNKLSMFGKKAVEPKVTTVNLRPFDLRTFRLTKN